MAALQPPPPRAWPATMAAISTGGAGISAGRAEATLTPGAFPRCGSCRHGAADGTLRGGGGGHAWRVLPHQHVCVRARALVVCMVKGAWQLRIMLHDGARYVPDATIPCCRSRPAGSRGAGRLQTGACQVGPLQASANVSAPSGWQSGLLYCARPTSSCSLDNW